MCGGAKDLNVHHIQGGIVNTVNTGNLHIGSKKGKDEQEKTVAIRAAMDAIIKQKLNHERLRDDVTDLKQKHVTLS
ncbi:MAG: hypothetical protein ACREQ5_09065 [Candidatus Dormibacteria bacterium]